MDNSISAIIISPTTVLSKARPTTQLATYPFKPAYPLHSETLNHPPWGFGIPVLNWPQICSRSFSPEKAAQSQGRCHKSTLDQTTFSWNHRPLWRSRSCWPLPDVTDGFWDGGSKSIPILARPPQVTIFRSPEMSTPASWTGSGSIPIAPCDILSGAWAYEA